MRAVGDPDPAQLKHRPPPGRRCPGRPRSRRVGLDLLRGADPQGHAVVEHLHPRAEPHHHAHLVLDQQDPAAEVRQHAAQDRDQLLALRLVQPGGRLVEQQVAGPGREGAGDPQQALARRLAASPPAARPARADRGGPSTSAATATARRLLTPTPIAPTATLSRQLRCGKGRAAWKVRPSPPRASRAGERPLTSTPSSQTVPESGA